MVFTSNCFICVCVFRVVRCTFIPFLYCNLQQNQLYSMISCFCFEDVAAVATQCRFSQLIFFYCDDHEAKSSLRYKLGKYDFPSLAAQTA